MGSGIRTKKIHMKKLNLGNHSLQAGFSKVAGCRRKLLPTWLVSAGYSAWHFFMGGFF